MAKVKMQEKGETVTRTTLKRPTSVRAPSAKAKPAVRTRRKAPVPPTPYHRPPGPFRPVKMTDQIPLVQMPSWSVAFVDNKGVVKAKIGPFMGRREANIAAKRVLLDIRRKVGGSAKVQALKSASVPERRKLASCNVVVVPGDVGYVYAAGTSKMRKAIIGKDVGGTQIRLNPRKNPKLRWRSERFLGEKRKGASAAASEPEARYAIQPVPGGYHLTWTDAHSIARIGSYSTMAAAKLRAQAEEDRAPLRKNPRRKKNFVGFVGNPKLKRRRNTHLAVGRTVSYKGKRAEVVEQKPRDHYMIRFDNGSLMTVSGRSLK